MVFTGHTRSDVLEKHYRKPDASVIAATVAQKIGAGRRGKPPASA